MKISDYISKNPRKIIFSVFLITIFFLTVIYVKGIHYEFEEENFLPRNEIVQANEEIFENYANKYIVPILIKARHGNILNKTALIEILQMESKIYESTKAEQMSIADVISSAFLLFDQSASYEDKINEMERRSDEDIRKLFTSPIVSNKILSFVSLLLSKDFDAKNVTAEACVARVSLNGSLIKDRERALIEEKKIKELAKGNYAFIEPYVLGGRLIGEEIMNSNRKSLSILLPISFFLVIAVLLFIYRRIRDVLLSLLSIAISIVWMYGFASLLNYSLNPLTTAVPVLLVGLGIDYSIHMRMRLKEEKEKGRRKEEAVKIALKTVGIALILSALTTSVAFLSNISSFIPLLQQFGIISAFGIFACLIITICFTPFYGEVNKKISKGNQPISFLLTNLAKIAQKRKTFILLLVSVITILMAYFAVQAEAEFDIMDFLPEKLEISKQVTYLLQKFEAAEGEEADVLVRANVANPEIIRKMYSTVENIEDDPYVVQIVSIFSVMEDYANESYGLNYNSTFSSLYYKIFDKNGFIMENATEEDVVALYDYLLTLAPDDLRYVVHKGDIYDGSVIRILTRTGKNERNISILFGELKKDVQIENAIVTGGIISSYIVLKELRASQIKSLLFTLLFSLILLEIVFLKIRKSVALAFISLLPVAFSAIWIIGTMFLLQISITVTTITVASLAIGLGIDYSIHMTHRFLEEEDFLSTISSTGSALFGSALTTIAAFGLLSFSLLPSVQLFGIAISIAVFYSFILCTFILPILLQIWKSSPLFK